MINNCTHNGRIKSVIIIKKPSRYMIKKYGGKRADEIMIEKALKLKT